MTILAVNDWATNGYLIADVAELYLSKEMKILDPTYGLGTWWTQWFPAERNLTATDLDKDKSPWGRSVDFRNMPWVTHTFDCVAFDPPYKLNGTPDLAIDERYGVHTVKTWQQTHKLIKDGLLECSRVLKVGGILLLKCMDQVCSGQIRWQTDEFTIYAALNCDLKKIDRFDMLGKHRKQPMEGREQRHAHGRGSTFIVFRKL